MSCPNQRKPVLFIDRDGVLVKNSLEDGFANILWIPGVFQALREIRRNGSYRFALVSNQPGVGTLERPADRFWAVHNRILKTLEGEGIAFDTTHVDFSQPEEASVNRKPGIGMLGEYLGGDYDLEHSLVIGDRLSDIELARNLGCHAIWFADSTQAGELRNGRAGELKLDGVCLLVTDDWRKIADWLLKTDQAGFSRAVSVKRQTKETSICLSLDLDGTGKGQMTTGLPFFDHMLQQIVRHGQLDVDLEAKGDLQVDEHHTVEDVGLVLGQAVARSLGDKRGISRYGFELLPMDDCLAQVAIDFSGRPWFKWEVDFKREYIGNFPTELFFHFFKSFSDEAKCNLHMKVSPGNAHHQAEALFKAFGRALHAAVFRFPWCDGLPSTKGVL